jgi:hypothetical protein
MLPLFKIKIRVVLTLAIHYAQQRFVTDALKMVKDRHVVLDHCRGQLTTKLHYPETGLGFTELLLEYSAPILVTYYQRLGVSIEFNVCRTSQKPPACRTSDAHC